MYYLKGDIITDGQRFFNKTIGISKGKIFYVGEEEPINASNLYITKGVICPGFVDIHLHGVSGDDFMDSAAAYDKIAQRLPRYGVTSFLATSRTASISDLEDFLMHARRFERKPSYAHLLGVHVEGPWISLAYPGAQKGSLIRRLTNEDAQHILLPHSDIISIITLAPEEVEDRSVLVQLYSNGIRLSAGHTNAGLEDMKLAITHGLRQVTHTFNAMSPVHHRSPGTAAAALICEELTCEIIPDGHHVHPEMIEFLYKVKGREKLMLISDCTGYNSLDDGEYFFRGKHLIKEGNQMRLKDGPLAGSAITLDKGVKYAVEQCRIPLEDAVYIAGKGPLQAIGKEAEKGSIKDGFDADLVVLNEELSVEMTIVAGEIVYKKE
ncbi:N-acetylglucosamine-6-phosphate deacetylase [Mangrovibacillus sp. Mu-81]|uniref:N-acetylglucosamine-6-phosphate deacetylase n=1 Tax=Mangrovibacillus sp. Mu-81 TaxID=3121478 RepID=UPI002FE4F7AC